MKYEKELVIKQSLADEIESLTTKGSQDFGEDMTIINTVVFDNGYEMDIKCCGVQCEDGSDNAAWTEAVLFHNGSEVCCSEPSDEYFGEWTLTVNGDEYTVDVMDEKTKLYYSTDECYYHLSGDPWDV